MLVDSHCHLDFPELAGQLESVFALMRENQVERALCVSVTLEDFPRVRKLAETYPHLHASVGVHPDYEGVAVTAGQLVALANHPRVGDVRGIGLLACVELVADRETLEPFPRQAQITESVVLRARQSGLLLYPSTGNVDGMNGDYLLIGPPLTVTDDEVDLIVDRMAITLGALG